MKSKRDIYLKVPRTFCLLKMRTKDPGDIIILCVNFVKPLNTKEDDDISKQAGYFVY